MPLVRLGHVNVKTDRFDESVAFYEVLGLRRGPAETMADRERNAWMQAPDGQPCVHLNSVAGPLPEPAGALDHVAFDAEDRPAMEKALGEAGIAFAARPFPDAGIVQLNLTDPNGVAVELTFREPPAI